MSHSKVLAKCLTRFLKLQSNRKEARKARIKERIKKREERRRQLLEAGGNPDDADDEDHDDEAAT